MTERKVTQEKVVAVVGVIVVVAIFTLILSVTLSGQSNLKDLFDSASELENMGLRKYGSEEVGYFSSSEEFELIEDQEYFDLYSSDSAYVALCNLSDSTNIRIAENDSDVRESLIGIVELPKNAEYLLNDLYNREFFVEMISIGGQKGVLCSETKDSSDDLAKAFFGIKADGMKSLYFISESGLVISVVDDGSKQAELIGTFETE